MGIYSPSWDKGSQQPARRFVAESSQKVSVAGITSYTGTVTQSLWVMPSVTNVNQGVWCTKGTNDYCVIYITSAGKIQYQAHTATATSSTIGTTIFVPNKWYHVLVIEYGGTSGRIIYVNGVADSGLQLTSLTLSESATAAYGWYANAAWYFNGSISLPCGWSAALTPSEIKSLASGTPPWLIRPQSIVSCPDLQSLYDPYLKSRWTNSGSTLAQPLTFPTPSKGLNRKYFIPPLTPWSTTPAIPVTVIKKKVTRSPVPVVWDKMVQPARRFVAASNSVTTAPRAIYPMTVGFWLLPTVADDWNTIWSSVTTNNKGYFIFCLSGRVRFWCHDAVVDDTSNAPATTVLNKWCYVAATIPSASSRTIYVNGIPGTTATGTAENITHTLLGFGRNLAYSNNPFTGSIALPCFWNTTLSPSEIRSLASGTPPWLIRPSSIVSCPDMGTLYDPFLKSKWTNSGSTLAQPLDLPKPSTTVIFSSPIEKPVPQVFNVIKKTVTRSPVPLSWEKEQPSRKFVAAGSQYLTVPCNITLPVTMACWVLPNNVTDAQTLMDIGPDSVVGSHRLQLRGDVVNDPIGCRSYIDNGSGWNPVQVGKCTLNRWVHTAGIIYTWWQLAAFCDGTKALSGVSNATIVAALNTLTIGRTSGTSPGLYSTGNILLPCFWNVALLDSEVKALAQGTLPHLIRPRSIVSCPDLRTLYDPYLKTSWTNSGSTLAQGLSTPKPASRTFVSMPRPTVVPDVVKVVKKRAVWGKQPVSWDRDQQPARKFVRASSQYAVASQTTITNAPFTFSAWVYLPGVTSLAQQIISIGTFSGAAAHLWEIYFGSTAAPGLRLGCFAGGASAIAITSNLPVAGAWNHVVGIAESNLLRVVILNGNMQGQGTNTTDRTPTGVDTICLGAEVYNSSFGGFLTGLVYLPCVHKTVLRQSEIKSLASGAMPWTIRPQNIVSCPDLQSLYDPYLRAPWTNSGSTLAAPPDLWRPKRKTYFVPTAVSPSTDNYFPVGYFDANGYWCDDYWPEYTSAGFKAAWARYQRRLIGTGVN